MHAWFGDTLTTCATLKLSDMAASPCLMTVPSETAERRARLRVKGETLMIRIEILRELAQELGPYLLMGILLPGGFLLAPLLYLQRQRSRRLVLERIRSLRP